METLETGSKQTRHKENSNELITDAQAKGSENI
jgi:hypothetical protein